MNYTDDDTKKLGTILGIWAHPDDESWIMGGIMAATCSNGQRVACITATRGDAGQTADESRWPQARLGEIRENELEKALDVLGVNEHYWLDYKDGHLAEASAEEAAEKIAEIIRRVKPDTVFSFGTDGITGHDDHRTMYEWTKRALEKAGSKANLFRAVEITERYNTPIVRKCDEMFNIYFNINEPETVPIKDIDLYYELPPEILKKKVESLRVQECQTAAMFANSQGREYIQTTTGTEAFMRVQK